MQRVGYERHPVRVQLPRRWRRGGLSIRRHRRVRLLRVLHPRRLEAAGGAVPDVLAGHSAVPRGFRAFGRRRRRLRDTRALRRAHRR